MLITNKKNEKMAVACILPMYICMLPIISYYISLKKFLKTDIKQ